jgi:lipopolysaccharide transport system ATP-binding protein
MSSEIAIKVENLSKCHAIYERPRDRLKQMVMGQLRSLLGKNPKSYYREFWALKDVSFEVKKGETVGIIGRNGSGKSTLLQMICGTLNPTNGSVQTYGRVAALLELGAGFNPEFTGRENVYLNAAVLGLTQAEIEERFDQITEFADIGDFIGQPVKTIAAACMFAWRFRLLSPPSLTFWLSTRLWLSAMHTFSLSAWLPLNAYSNQESLFYWLPMMFPLYASFAKTPFGSSVGTVWAMELL